MDSEPGSSSLRRDLAALAIRYSLPATAAEQLERLARMLATPGAPSRLRELARIRDDHLADALVALELPQVRAARKLADLGAGAGVPGLPLAIALPDAHVTLVESNASKARFIAAAIKACEVGNASVANARAEDWPNGIGRCELVTARALAALPVIAEYAAPLLRPGGALLAWRGRIDATEEAAARSAALELGLEYAAPEPVVPYPGAEHRHLQLLTKVAPTPPRFPRRPGMARKRPLGGAPRAPSDRARR